VSFVLGPALWIFILSILSKGVYGGYEFKLTADNYKSILSWNYLIVFFRSLELAAVTGLLTVAIGVFISWGIMSASEARRKWLLFLVCLPFLINLIIRVYAIRSFVGFDGPLQMILQKMGIEVDPFSFTSNVWLVYFGMVTSYLPFSILPLYASFNRFDFTVFEAAQDLGAGTHKAFFKVVLPNMKVPLLNSFVLVFIPALGEYVIPDLLGGAKTMYLGNLMTEEFLKNRNWPTGAAIACILIVMLFISILILRSVRKEGAHES
jgi:spermidine/putrescine transport system permease protein